MNSLNKTPIAVLIALVVMMLIAAGSGYRLQISPFGGITFEQTAKK